MDWIIAGMLGLLFGWGAQIVYLHLTKYQEESINVYHKSHKHYRDGDNT
jgi:hypothetical protein